MTEPPTDHLAPDKPDPHGEDQVAIEPDQKAASTEKASTETAVETNVIDPGPGKVTEQTLPGPKPAKGLKLTDMPKLESMTLHSPSTEIIGTPFSTGPRFEYPFPESTPPSTGPASPSLPPISSSSSLPTLSLGYTPGGSQHGPTSNFPPLELGNFSPTHPKHRSILPPVPPGLLKKGKRWGLNLLNRRRSSSGSTSSLKSSDASSLSATSPMEERAMAMAIAEQAEDRGSATPESHSTAAVNTAPEIKPS